MRGRGDEIRDKIENELKENEEMRRNGKMLAVKKTSGLTQEHVAYGNAPCLERLLGYVKNDISKARDYFQIEVCSQTDCLLTALNPLLTRCQSIRIQSAT